MFLTDHLQNAAKAAKRKPGWGYYFFHAWVALKCGTIYYYIAFFSQVHAIFPFVHADFGLAEMIVARTNVIRKSIPNWEGWKELDNWDDEKYAS
tara:strand:- start:2705 stop:2986 length:282 start_codon:yes stop_codon:yes gene_type:complete